MSEQYPGQVAEVPVIESMIESWKQFQGQTLNGEFELRDYLGGSTHSAVFLTEYDHQVASIHLISENAPDRDRQLASWQLATELSHVNLIRVFQVGICQLANERVFYAVMELPDENLGQILTQRVLTAEETMAMLAPALDALAYLHKREIVHHSINPANIGALGDQLKLSVGTLARSGQANSHPGLYDPPEPVSTPAADAWALGLTIVEVLTQRLPSWQRDAQGDPDITASVPQPLSYIVRNSLRRDARRRLTVKQISARLNPSAVSSAAETEETAPSAPATIESKPAISASTSTTSASTVRRAETPAPAAAPSRIEPPQTRSTYSQSAPKVPSPRREMAAPSQPSSSKKSSYRTPVIVVVLLLAAFAGYRFFFSSHGADPSTAVATQQESQPETNVATPFPAATPASPAKSSAAAPKAAPINAAPAGRPAQPKVAPKSEASSIGGNASGSVVHQALPDVPDTALNTVHGTFHVVVRATSDASGTVSDASIDSRGPSQYFANLALKASHDWKFSPNAPGDWLIRFEFTSDGVTASATPAN